VTSDESLRDFKARNQENPNSVMRVTGVVTIDIVRYRAGEIRRNAESFYRFEDFMEKKDPWAIPDIGPDTGEKQSESKVPKRPSMSPRPT
jgi:hypothetical protein